MLSITATGSLEGNLKLKEVRIGMFDRLPDEDGMESLDLLATILDEKPQLRVDFIYSMDRENFMDSLSYLMAVESFQEKEDSVVLRDLHPLPDSLLGTFLRRVMPGIDDFQDSSLQYLCKLYTGAEVLAGKYDSTRIEQTDFISDFLQENKSLPSDRFNFHFKAPDTLLQSNTLAILHVIFKSLDSADD